MNGSVGVAVTAVVEDQVLLGADSHVDTTRARGSDTVAREVGTRGVERVLDGIALNGSRDLHEQVCAGGGEEGDSRRDGGSVLHCDFGAGSERLWLNVSNITGILVECRCCKGRPWRLTAKEYLRKSV